MFSVSMWLLYTSDSGDWSLTDVAGIKAGGTVNIMAVIHWRTATTTIEILSRERGGEWFVAGRDSVIADDDNVLHTSLNNYITKVHG